MKKLLLIISGPSAVGKRGIIRGIATNCKQGLIAPKFNKVVLYNSRQKRDPEQDGIDYHFIDRYSCSQSNRVSKLKQLCLTDKNNYHTGVKEQCSNFFSYHCYDTDMQAIDLEQITSRFTVLEIKDVFISKLRQTKKFKSFVEIHGVKVVNVFIAPLTKFELERQSNLLGLTHVQVLERDLEKRIRDRIANEESNETEIQIRARVTSGAEEVLRAYQKKINYNAIFVNNYFTADLQLDQKSSFTINYVQDVLDQITSLVNIALQNLD